MADWNVGIRILRYSWRVSKMGGLVKGIHGLFTFSNPLTTGQAQAVTLPD